MPAENGVGSMSAGFGSGATYPFKGSYLGLFRPKGLVGTPITSWPSDEGPLTLGNTGTATRSTMPDGVTPCAKFLTVSDGMFGTNANLDALHGINTTFLLAIDGVDDDNTGGANMIFLGDTAGSQAMSAVAPATGITRRDGVTTLNNGIGGPFPTGITVGDRSIFGIAVTDVPTFTTYKIDLVTLAVTSNIIASTTALAFIGNIMIGIGSANFPPFGWKSRVSQLWLRQPTDPTESGCLSEMTKILRYMVAHPQ